MRKLTTAAALALALAAPTDMLMADRAGAWEAELTVTTSCQVDGSWTASWSISNSESETVMEITAEDVTTFAPNPTPFSGTSTSDTTHANDVASVTANVTVHWPENETISYSATALRPEACVVPPTTTTTAPPTTTTVPLEPPAVLIPPLVIEAPPVGELPRTGTGTGLLVAAGFGLLTVGTFLLVAKSRRLRGDVG